MNRITNKSVNVLLVTSCSFTELAIKTLLDSLQASLSKPLNIAPNEYCERDNITLDFIICAGDLFNEMSLHSIAKIKAALKHSHFSTKMVFITSRQRFSLSYFISILCRKECYCIAIDQSVEEMILTLEPVFTQSDVFNPSPRNAHLTTREKEIIIGLIKQVKPIYLSKRYAVDQKTISAHKMNALRKLNVERLSEIISLNVLT
jgi:DNA-binding CsgD family transcriptional regulator